MSAPFKKLTESQMERLALLLEELGEAQHAIGKIIRHGYESSHPQTCITNTVMLESELGDVIYSIKLMIENGDINKDRVEEAIKSKQNRVKKYLHFSHKYPMLDLF